MFVKRITSTPMTAINLRKPSHSKISNIHSFYNKTFSTFFLQLILFIFKFPFPQNTRTFFFTPISINHSIPILPFKTSRVNPLHLCIYISIYHVTKPSYTRALTPCACTLQLPIIFARACSNTPPSCPDLSLARARQSYIPTHLSP